ncbi:MAG TPA: tetratricopeptide repeat protein, partial [Myxococcaceae bacterium]|nr:tetratricopeptide repeat protein [Myxococcaceae bacterium]
TRLEAAAARAPEDVELSLVLAEAYAAKHQSKQAADALLKVLAKHKDSAKALHALGNIRQADKNADEAAKLYAQALEADPNHVSSAIELASVELLIRKDAAKGKAALAKALDDKRKQLMGPAELAQARALTGVLLEMQNKHAEAIAEFKEAQKLDPDSVFVKGRLGRALMDDGDFAGALPLFQDAARRDPLNLDYTDGFLSALLAAGKMIDAKTVVAAANTRFPGNARIAYLFGRVEDALDNTSDAEGHYRRALNADPKLYEPNLYLAEMYLRFKRYADAKTELDAAAQKAPNVAKVHSSLGQLALAQDDFDRAETEFKKSLELDANQAPAHLGLSSVALARNNPSEAKAEALKALELEPKVAGGRRQLGLALWKLGDLDGAITELEKAKADEPRSASVLLTIGAVRIERADKGAPGELGIAEASISSALSLEPTNAECHFYMARVKNRRLEHTQAIENMRNALERAPNNASYHYEMGVIFHDAKRGSDAIDEWTTALKLNPSYADPLEAMGHAYLDRADFDKAIDYFQKCLKIDPKRTRVLAAIGDAFFAAQKWDKAIERYQQALKADSSYAPAYYQIGRAYTERGESAKAIDWYRRATSADSKNAQAYYYLAFAYKDRGLKGEAIQAFKSYLAKRPDAEDKKEIEDEIYDLTHE